MRRLSPSGQRKVFGLGMGLVTAVVGYWMFFSDGLPIIWGPSARASEIAAGRDLFEREEAMADLLYFFADEREIHSREKVIRLVDRAGRRVFDRQHRVISGAVLHRDQHFMKRRVTAVLSVGIASAEVVLSGEKAVRAFGALVRDDQCLL